MAEPTPAEEIERMTKIFSGVDHLVELLKSRSYDDLRVMGADLVATFVLLERDRGETLPLSVLEGQQRMLENLLNQTRAKMGRDWTDLDTMLFGIEVAETSHHIHDQAARIGVPRSQIAVSMLALMFLHPEQYIESLRVRNSED